MTGALGPPIDGLVDATTVALGLTVVLAKIVWRWSAKHSPIMSVARCGNNFLNGSMIVPFVLMVGAVFSHTVLDYLRSASPVTTALAGGIGLIFVVGEISRT